MWDFVELTDEIRDLMLEEFGKDAATDSPYLGKHLSESGKALYPGLAQEAFRSGTPETLAHALGPVLGPNWLARYQRQDGAWRNVSSDAAERLAGGEFNRYYIRAICSRAISQGLGMVKVYRALTVETPRDSSPRIGQQISAKSVLADARRDYDVPPRTGIPHGPNSGLSVRTVRQ